MAVWWCVERLEVTCEVMVGERGGERRMRRPANDGRVINELARWSWDRGRESCERT